LRVVLDTNVLLSGIATHGLCEGIVTLCLRDHTIVLSEHILDELAEHYAGKFKAAGEQTAAVTNILRQNSELVVPTSIPKKAFDDKDDLPVLGTAVAGHADCLVTGDKGLLELNEFQGIPILSPRGFHDLLQAGG
jgi:putative PIN family toxin of toxin-antitoxin system